jgi:NTP pyrophosphatase (non-canonical NTP hydrolase)
MRMNEYQGLASRTANDHEYSLINYGLGLTGESGEVADIIKKHMFHGHEMDNQDILKELGDVLWYVSNIARECGFSLETVASQNINKLKKRYPEGFSTERSVNRDE